MRNVVKGLAVAASVYTLTLSNFAFAEPFGLLNGRSADLSRMPDTAVDLGMVTGEFYDIDYEHFGGRFNYKYDPITIIYGDLGQTTQEISPDVDGMTYGIGVYRQMDGVLTNSDFAIHASYHKFKLEPPSEFTGNFSGSAIILEGLFSGKEAINESGSMYWYGSIGMSRWEGKITGNESDTETDLTFSLGVNLQTASKSGEIYAGIIHIDDLGFGAGYRHYLK